MTHIVRKLALGSQHLKQLSQLSEVLVTMATLTQNLPSCIQAAKRR